jgi:hypothetical protein
MKTGSTFRFTDPEIEEHLWFVISDFTAESVVSVNLTSLRTSADRACILVPGDHPFVAHESYIAYNYARLIRREELQLLISDGLIIELQPAAADLMQKVWDGAARTKQLPIKCRELLRAQGLI